MAKSLDCATSSLLCAESTNTCFDDFDGNATDGFGVSPSWNHQNNHTVNQDSIFDNIRSESLLGFPLQSEERVIEMVEREREHSPRDDYLKRLRSGDLDLSVRRDALDWIWKVGLIDFSQMGLLSSAFFIH
jgi:cyclin D1/2/4